MEVGSQLASKIPKVDEKPHDYLGPMNPKSICFLPTHENEIVHVVNSLKPNASPGEDSLSPKIIRIIIKHIALPLSKIYNLSLLTGCFPNKLKVAKVTPIFKADDRQCVSNYRPISVLPFFSKILEKIMYNRLMSFFTKYNILTEKQFGFREQLSTYLALLSLIDTITNELDAHKFSLGIFIDLSKAFDTLDHNILLSKLAHYGIRGIINDWFHSYLSDRLQFVSIGSSLSSKRVIKCGVPQGSILGPLLFIIYINDIINVTKLATLILYADDTNMFLTHSDLDVLIQNANNELAKLSKWFAANKLSLNIKKTNFILFRTRNKKINCRPEIKVDNVAVTQVTCTKFLGVLINETLTWNDHIRSVLNKVSKSTGVIRRVSHKLPVSILMNLYSTLVHPYFEYCNIIWASDYTSHVDKVMISQRKVLRAVHRLSWTACTKFLFAKYSLLNIIEINKLQTGCFVYKALNGLLPHYFSYLFTSNCQIHVHDTRHSEDLHILGHRTHLRSTSIRICGVKIWNSIDAVIRNSHTFNLFKKHLKHYLIFQSV